MVNRQSQPVLARRVFRGLGIVLLSFGFADVAAAQPAPSGGAAAGPSVSLGDGADVFGPVERVLRAHLAEVQACYGQPASGPPSEGNVRVRIEIAQTGVVTAAEIAESTLASPSVEQCILRAIRTWRFAPSPGAGTAIVRPLFVLRLPSASARTGGATAGRTRSASGVASTSDGEFTLRGLDRSVRHTHGGEPARLGHVAVEATNRGRVPRRLRAVAVEFLHGHDCENPPAQIVATPRPSGLLVLTGGVQRDSTLDVAVAAGATVEAEVGFAPAVEAYSTWCDRFAFRVLFRVDGSAPLSVVSEMRVIRVERVTH